MNGGAHESGGAIHAVPYPHSRIERVSQAEVELAEWLYRAEPLWERMKQALSALLTRPAPARLIHMGAVKGSEAVLDVGAGWLGALRDAAGRVVGWVHLDTAIAQWVALRALGEGGANGPELRPLVPVERHALEALFAAMCWHAGVSWRCAGVEPTKARERFPDLVGRVVLRLEDGASSGLVVLLLDLRRGGPEVGVADSAPTMASFRRSPLWRDLRRRARMVIARLVFSGPEWTALDAGDLLLPQSWHGARGVVIGELCWGGRPMVRLEYRWQGPALVEVAAGFTAEEDLHMAGWGEGRDTVPMGKSSAIIVEVVLGTRMMTLGEVMSLHPGQILVGQEGIDDTVTLQVGDRVVARGELVDVEGRLGVRLLGVGDEEG